ncbi:hypothetical protein [Tenacibaculum sp. ZS6-P6]|uniref:hypothetical protein n=1 Tax=Tenacibaculum sp. ZS6-P6 TaxID=3447503 RepID=UPI003F96724E
MIVAFLFFAFEFLEKEGKATIVTRERVILERKANSKELNELKSYVRQNNPDLYARYIHVNKQFKKSKADYNQAIEDDKFLGFKSFKIFSYQFFPTLLFFLYVVYHLYISVKERKKNIGIKIIHLVFLLFSIVKIYWVFQSSADLSRGEYYILAVITTILVSFSVWLFHKKELTWNRKVKKKLMKVSYYAMVNCDEDKTEDMAKIIEQPIK